MIDSNAVADAREHHQNGEYEQAGDLYTLGGFEHFSERVPDPFAWNVARGEFYLSKACVCYAITGMNSRQKNRAQHGILIAEDMIERFESTDFEADFDAMRKGAWFEYVGDFMLLSGNKGYDEWYERARETYLKYNDPPVGQSEQDHRRLIRFFELLLDDLPGEELEEWHNEKAFATFSEWIEFKRHRISEALDTIIERGRWNCTVNSEK